jgi:hypothetical protein
MSYDYDNEMTGDKIGLLTIFSCEVFVQIFMLVYSIGAWPLGLSTEIKWTIPLCLVHRLVFFIALLGCVVLLPVVCFIQVIYDQGLLINDFQDCDKS